MSTDDMSRSAVDFTDSRLAETFVALADTLVADFDVFDLLDRLVAASVGLLGASAAGLLLDDQRGNLALVASSDDDARLLEVLQLETDEGPCLESVREGTAVVSDDLEMDRARWATFAPAALAAGYRSVVAVPLRLRDETIGGLNLFCTEPSAISEGNRRLAQALADVATIGILQQRSAHRNTVLAEQLQHALNSRVVIEQAKGIIAERSGVDMATAYTRLRQHARSHNLKLSDVARGVVSGDPGLFVSGE